MIYINSLKAFHRGASSHAAAFVVTFPQMSSDH